MRTAKISIDSKAFNHNINLIAKLTNKVSPNSSSTDTKNTSYEKNNTSPKIMIMLKANAYGHGIDLCTLAVLKNNNVEAIGVATMEEALLIRSLGWERDLVLIEGVFSQQEWQTAISNEMQCLIHHKQQLDWAIETLPCDTSPTRNIWLKYNTGMNRLGFSSEEITDVSKLINEAGYQQILISHFANSDDRECPINAQQGMLFSQKFEELKQQVNPDIKGSLCNSAGIINYPDWHYDWVRAGIMIYGSSPLIDRTAADIDLQPVMTLSTKIMAIHDINTGEMVGYGSRWTATKPSKIAILSIGYGDGYPRVVDDTTYVNVMSNNNTGNVNKTSYSALKCPVIGRVAMDMIAIDISHENKENTVNIDDTVILWGTAPHIDDVAKSANTIAHELLCRLTTRPKRVLQSLN